MSVWKTGLVGLNIEEVLSGSVYGDVFPKHRNFAAGGNVLNPQVILVTAVGWCDGLELSSTN